MQSISSYINPNTRGLTSNYKNTAIIRYRQKNNLLSIQFQPSYILMTVLERLTQTKKNNFD